MATCFDQKGWSDLKMLLSEYKCITSYLNDDVFSEKNDDFSARK